MDKNRKLRLKRKLPQQKPHVTVETEENQTDAILVTVSSDSDCDGGQPSKQRKITDEPKVLEEKGFLHTKNPSLNKLREMILTLSPKDVEVAKLSPFPAFDMEVEKSDERENLIKGRLQSLPKLQPGEVLSPFPKPCKHFRKSSREASHEQTNEKTRANAERLNSVTVQYTEKQDKHGNSSADKDLQDIEKTATKPDTNFKVRTSHIGGYIEENSAIIRDRNSNYYSLQSQNTSILAERKKPEPVISRTNKVDKLSSKTNNSGNDVDKQEYSDIVIVDKVIVNKQNPKSKVQTSSSISNANAPILKEDENARYETRDSAMLRNNIHSRGADVSSFKDKSFIDGESRNCIYQKKLPNNNIPKPHSSKGNEKIRHVTVTQENPSIIIPRASSSKGGENVSEGSKEELKDGVALKSCPLCQMKFDSGIGQMELDSHIAACLSTSEDDVIW